MKRTINESFEKYKLRQKEENKAMKQQLKGKLIHVSKTYMSKEKGITYKSDER